MSLRKKAGESEMDYIKAYIDVCATGKYIYLKVLIDNELEELCDEDKVHPRIRALYKNHQLSSFDTNIKFLEAIKDNLDCHLHGIVPTKHCASTMFCGYNTKYLRILIGSTEK